ncbi:MAG: PTS sugar transporter subunit IIA [Planctomycetota bacterium]
MASQDLDVEELAAYLHLTPQQVRRLADREQIPARRISGSWVFSEAEIHSWLEDKIGASDGLEELSKVEQVIDRWSKNRAAEANSEWDSSLANLLPEAAIDVPFQARTRSSVVRRICSLAESTGMLWDAGRMTEAVLAREDLHPTALDNGVAMLHPRRPQTSILSEPFLALGVSPQPIPFGNKSGHLTDIFFLICSTDDRVHLQVLAKLSRLLTQGGFLAELRACSDPRSAHSLLARAEEELDEGE